MAVLCGCFGFQGMAVPNCHGGCCVVAVRCLCETKELHWATLQNKGEEALGMYDLS